MKTTTRNLAFGSGVLFALTQMAIGQGSLTPPGVPGPMFKTLEQVEPRIPIAAGTNLGSLIIREPGSYYLTGNRQTAGTAIFIRTNGVTIDFNGYSLLGGGNNEGVRAEHQGGSAIERIVIRNGSVAGFGSGVHLIRPRGCRVSDMIVTGNDGPGIELDTDVGDGSVIGNLITHCQAYSNSSAGIYLQAGDAPGDACSGNIISHCTTSGSPGRTGASNSGYGIWLFGSSAAGSGGTSGNIIEYCTAANNLRSGFRFSGSGARMIGNRIVGCNATLNGSHGFEFVSAVTGQLLGNVVTQCLSTGNGGEGFILSGNGGASGNVISHNQAMGNAGRGFWTGGTAGGLVAANFAFGNTNGNYLLGGTDTVGPVITTSGTLANTGNDAHHAANISR